MLKAQSIQKRHFETTLYVRPIGKGRPRMSRGGNVYTPSDTVRTEAEIKWLLRKENPPLFQGAVTVNATFRMLRPKSAPKSRIYPTTRPDIDNIFKMLCDSMNGILFCDDSQIVQATIRKEYGAPEGIELRVIEL